MGGTRVLVTRCTNVGSKALHVSLQCVTSCHRLPSPALPVATARIRRIRPAIDTFSVPAIQPHACWIRRAPLLSPKRMEIRGV